MVHFVSYNIFLQNGTGQGFFFPLWNVLFVAHLKGAYEDDAIKICQQVIPDNIPDAPL